MTRLSQGNRGMSLELLINHSNQIYYERGQAVVNKRPTPVKIVKTKGTRILSAYLESPSTVDYEGTYQGHSLQFEAKSTKQLNRFPMDNVHLHQINHLRARRLSGAITFAVIEFAKRNTVFYVPGELIERAWDAAENGGKKSIPFDDLSRECLTIGSKSGIPLDYLAAVDEHIRQMALL
ncbi:Holliday junction resolvase RecU [Alicyclobacillus sp. SO9]|uniref:Holliday junction resolvase RecU n=1 Tax=Alicyclobacillus sp. SO9 TaxID=2665646 RepID=UPI0018E8FE95|nr:Holliday junction resolvase RecU [Alicyclobacillus sp. SO9]QQE80910.1 Holliday junction resolvase RecU [Alicyclobacillus sp. SO9]